MTITRSVRLFGLFSFFDGLDFYLSIKIIYFQHLTNSYAAAASIVSFIWIFSALLEVPTGIFSDRIGRKKTMMLGAFCAVIGYVLYALGTHYWILVSGAFIEGASRAFYSGNNHAYLHNVLSREGQENEYHHYFGQINSLATTGSVIATMLTGFLTSWSFIGMMWINVVPQFLAFVTTFFMPEITVPKGETSNIFAHLKEAVREMKNNVNLRLLSITKIFGGSSTGLVAYEFQSAVMAAVWPLWAIGIARTLQEVGGIPGFYFAGRLINKFGAMNIVFFTTIQSWLSNVIAAVFPSIFSPLFISSSAFFYGPEETATQSLLQKEFSDRQRATIASLNSLAGSLVFALLSFVVGIYADVSGPFKALLFIMVLEIPVIYLQWLLFKRIGKPWSTDRLTNLR